MMKGKRKATEQVQPADKWNVSPKLTFRLSEDLRSALETHCRRHELPPSDVVRQALAELLGQPELAHIGRRGRRWPGSDPPQPKS